MSNRLSTFPHSLPARFLGLGLVALTISGNFTNYGGMQEELDADLHTTDQTIGLLSTTLYLGIACGYVAGGLLVDRFGPRRVLVAALLAMGLGNSQLAVMPHLNCVLLCRFLVG